MFNIAIFQLLIDSLYKIYTETFTVYVICLV